MRRNTINKLLAVAGVLMLAVGGLLLWGSAYIHNEVTSQLAAQKVYFPPASAFAHPKVGTEFTPSMIPSVSQYAGQQLLTGQQAQSYADNFIAVHLQGIGGGKTYAQLSAEAMAHPTNTALAGEVQAVFRGDTLRSMLLNAFGWWKVSQIAYIVSLASFGVAVIAFLLAAFGIEWSAFRREEDEIVRHAREMLKVS